MFDDPSAIYGSGQGPGDIQQPVQPLASQQSGAAADPGIIGRTLGLDLDDPGGNRVARASLGAGLSAVANNWNKPALAAFAGGAGASLQGQGTAEQQQDAQDLAWRQTQAKIIHDNLNLMIKARAEGDMAKFREGHLAILRAGQARRPDTGATMAPAGPAAPIAPAWPPAMPGAAGPAPPAAPASFNDRFAGAPVGLARPPAAPAAATKPPPEAVADAGAATPSGPPPAAIDHLRQNPALRLQFDAKYGAGAGARALGQ